MAEYKVIRILNQKEILINYGYRQGAYEGQEIRVIEPGEDIFYPDNNLIGNLYTIKDTLSIHSTYENFSVCRKIIKEEKKIYNPFDFTYVKTTFQDLNVDNTYYKKDWEKAITAIKVGDDIEIISN